MNATINIPGYAVLGLIGRGGMGMVYEATRTSTGERVALKIVAPDVLDTEAFAQR